MKKRQKRERAARSYKAFIRTLPRPQTINFFQRFVPDSMAKTNFENAAFVHSFFTGEVNPFSLYSPMLDGLVQEAFAGSPKAMDLLVKICTHLCFNITALERAHAEIMSKIARKQNVWPIAASPQPDSNEKRLAALDELGVGKDVGHIDIPFKKAAGSDANYPARRWAKAAVHCLNSTRFYQRELTANEKSLAEKLKTGNWERGNEPAWVPKTKDLPDFVQTPAALKKWASLIKEMIREQMSDFETRPEWANQRNSCAERGRDTKGQIQNVILDDIVSALKTISPAEANQTS